jgi:flotillin
MPTLAFLSATLAAILAMFLVIVVGVAALFVTFFRKVEKGKALVRTGLGGTRVSFDGMPVIPIIHRLEVIDISVKRIEIDRSGRNGLICQDNMRADIKVAFFVRVNQTPDDVLRVAQAIGCQRASNVDEIRALFDAKFSEALKTVGKRFPFTSLYEERDTFRDEIVKVIGTNLNGFVLDDASIDYLEQTPLEALDPENILDAEGIKKITELTATQAQLANKIQREKEKVIKQQDVEAREAILEMERQLAETEAKQKREIETAQAREAAEAARIREQERLKADSARIVTEEELAIAEENKQRQILVAQRNKERTDAVEIERVERERQMEIIERERLTTLKAIEKEKVVEIEKKNIQEVIKERVALQKTVVIEQEKIKDTEAFASAERQKQVALTLAEKAAQEQLIARIKEAEASQEAARRKAEEAAFNVTRSAQAAKEAAQLHAEERVILAEAEEAAAEKEAEAKKLLAEAIAKETAAAGLGQAEVIRAQSEAEADGIRKKADAMKLLEEAGQAHEEFKLRLDKEKAVDLAKINIHGEIAARQAEVVGEALKHSRIDIVGGETEFFNKITSAVGMAKSLERSLETSPTLQVIKDTFFNGDPEHFKTQLRDWIDRFGVTSEDAKNLTVAALLAKLMQASPDETSASTLRSLAAAAQRFAVDARPVREFLS